MTLPDAKQLLVEKVGELGQAEVARRLGVSAAAISQIISGKYQASPDSILRKVVEIFGGITVSCPVLGQVPLAQCSEERKKPFAATSHQRVALYRACQHCQYNK